MSTGFGRLYLIPTTLGPSPFEQVLPNAIKEVITRLDCFLVEDEKSARAFIKGVCPERVIRDISLARLNEHTHASDIDRLLEPMRSGRDVGIISEAGCPAIADPGGLAVKRAHEIGITVVPLVGPCSMLLALMASGFNGQRWRFVGYLPIESAARKEAILDMEKNLYRLGESQIVMDTPYRNTKLFGELLNTCKAETKLCVAAGLTTSDEWIRVDSIGKWKARKVDIQDIPTVFVLGL